MNVTKHGYKLLGSVVLIVAWGQPLSAETLLERGTYLMKAITACGNCHTPDGPDGKLRMDMEMAGGREFKSDTADVFVANLTPDRETGIGTWTDEQIIHAFRNGLDPRGRSLNPPMPVPTYNNMSDDDAKAIVAYLRALKPVRNSVPDSTWKVPAPKFPAAKGAPAPAKTDKVAYGSYIVNALAHCFECHTTPIDGIPDFAGHLGAGGRQFGDAKAPIAANITPDPETGIGKWTDADIKKALTQGIEPSGRRLNALMPYGSFANMTPEDLDSVVAYLRTLKPVKNKVVPPAD